MAGITIYHNPQCGTSRNTLALIRNSGEEPEVIEYLQTPPSRETLVQLIAAMGIPVRELIRQKGTPYVELKLDDSTLSDAAGADPDWLITPHPLRGPATIDCGLAGTVMRFLPPIAALALVPSGTVSGAAFDAIRVVSAAFPFKPTLAALDAGLNRTGDLALPLLHLALLAAAYLVLARVALRRFGAR